MINCDTRQIRDLLNLIWPKKGICINPLENGAKGIEIYF
jgi:hypothetical protein